jgi:hypothetical protein
MQFKHPEILVALLLLIIPIIVHLFQLQRFIKVPFTNVAFLKRIVNQNRKSSKLKKFLVLISRMLAMAFLIMAFAQPYFSKNSQSANYHTNIYLDNSLSMQVKSLEGDLLKNAAQQIIDFSQNKINNVTVFTNSATLNSNNLKNELIALNYSAKTLNFETALLQLNSFNKKKENTLYKNIFISDFQIKNFSENIPLNKLENEVAFIQLKPLSNDNIFIDSVYISNNDVNNIALNVILKSVNPITQNVSVSLFENTQLFGKTSAIFKNSNKAESQFFIQDKKDFNGKIVINDAVLEFDNTLYFSISKPKKINILYIGNTSEYLKRIFNNNEFNFIETEPNNINFGIFNQQHLIFVNELNSLTEELTQSLTSYLKNGGNLVVIPSQSINIDSYNSFFTYNNLGRISKKIEKEHKITTINYNHKLLQNVFEKQVSNFQYPMSKSHYILQNNFANPILSFDSSTPFIQSITAQNGVVYWVGASLDKQNSNFTQSSLVVPIFYNFGSNSLQVTELYYRIEPNLEIEISAQLNKDQVLKLSNENTEFIPLQKVAPNKVVLNLSNFELNSGFYNIMLNNTVIKTIALNYNKNESVLTYNNVESFFNNENNAVIINSLTNYFEKIDEEQKINWLFKWFLAFSVLFLLVEMLLLNYFKT